MKLIKKILSGVSALVLVFGLAAVVPATSSAVGTSGAESGLNANVCNGITTVVTGDPSSEGAGPCTSAEGGNSALAKTINNVINLFSMVVGAASIIMIIYGGFKYITSGGNDDSTKDAKNTILYAIVGLIIVLVSQTIVKFVFSKATQINNDSTSL